MSLLLIAGQRLLEAAADEEAVLVDEDDCLVDEDDFVADEVAFWVLSVVGSFDEEDDLVDDWLVLNDDDFDDNAADDFEVLLDLAELDIDLDDGEAVEPEETMVAACWELRTETIDEAIEEVFTEDVEDSVLLADLSCGLTE